MQLNKRTIDVMLRLTLSLFAIGICAFVLLSPYVLRMHGLNAGDQVHLTLNTAFAQQEQSVDPDMGTIKYFTSGAFLISITGVLLSYSGWILNSSIEYFIVDMGRYLGTNSAIGSAIIQSWTIIRDIINLTFVFGLIYLAFMTIAKADTAKLKHGIANILIGALLINFSIFFGKAIIDISNVTAIEIYQQMSTLVNTNAAGGTGAQQTIDVGITGFFANRLGVLDLVDPNKVANNLSDSVKTKVGSFGFGFSIFVSLIFLITSLVFIAGGILIAIRFVVLAMLLILSPVAFAFAFLPKIHTEEWSRMWWDKIVAQALFAPAYLLLLYIAMNVANVRTLVGGGNITDFFSGQAGNSIGAFMNFVLIIGFLAGAIIVSKKMGAYGASTMASWGKSARVYSQRALLRGVGGATAGTIAVAGRRTLGRIGYRYASGENSEKYKEMAAKGGLSGIYARRVLSAARTAEKASFDARQVGGVGRTLGVGEGKTGGYKQTLEDVAERDEKFAKSLGTVGDKDPRVMALKATQKLDEEHLVNLRNKKEVEKAKGPNADLAVLNQLDHEIHDQEEKIDKAKKAVDQEKNRRQVGSAVTTAESSDPEYTRLGTDIKNKKGDIKRLAESLARETDPTVASTRRKDIQNAQKELEHLEEEQADQLAVLRKANGVATGYAGYVESFSKGKMGFAWSAVYGRNRQMNKKSAEELRETYKKKDKEKKDHKPAAKPSAAPSAAPAAGGGGDHGGGDGHH